VLFPDYRESIKNVLAMSSTHAMIAAEKTIARRKELLGAKLGPLCRWSRQCLKVLYDGAHSAAMVEKSERAGFCVAIV
jgi:hypothetical protein